MIKNPPDGMPACSPYLFYDDVAGAVRFLGKAFGLETRFAHKGPDGKVGHAQLTLGSALVMLGATKAPGSLQPARSPKEAGSLNASVYLFVDDVDSHCRRARDAGAKILSEPTETFWGDRIYCALDPEGQFWCFATHVRDMPI